MSNEIDPSSAGEELAEEKMKKGTVEVKPDRRKLLLVLLVILILGLGTYFYMSKKSPITEVKTVLDANSLKTYTNTANGYSFEYPADKEIICAIGNLVNQPANPDARIVDIIPPNSGQIDSIFGVTSIGNTDISPSSLEKMFSSPDTIRKGVKYTTLPITIDGVDGYQLIVEPASTNSATHNLYFVKSSNGNLQIEYLKDDQDAKNILASFKFTSRPASTSVSPTSTATSSTVVPVADWKTYTNDAFGFQLTLNDLWKGYTTYVKDGDENAYKYIYFLLPTTDKATSDNSLTSYGKVGYASPFVISVYTLDGWAKELIALEEIGRPADPILKTDKYIFTYSNAQSCPPDQCDKKLDVAGIIKTIKLN